MNVLMHNRHIPHAHMMITAMPEVYFDCLGWYRELRPLPQNATYVSTSDLKRDYDAVIDDDWIAMPTKPVDTRRRILLLHCEHDGGDFVKHGNLKYCANQCDKLVSVSDHKRLTLLEVGLSDNVSVIPFGFDVDKFPQSDHSSLIVGAVHNGIDLSSEIQLLASQIIDDDGILIGHNNASWTKRKVSPDNYDWFLSELGSLGIFVNVVCGESFGMSPHEAMAFGIPVVTGNCIDAAAVAFDNWNICMPRLPALQAIDWIKDKIAQLKGDQALRKRIGSAGRETVRHLFNHHLLRDRWMKVLS